MLNCQRRSVTTDQSSQRVMPKAGFTLIEILIVLGIVVILAAISLAVFGRIREKGRQITCLNNLKQLALAMQQYVQDNDGRFPADDAQWGLKLFPYTKSTEILRCPSAPRNPHPVATEYLLYPALVGYQFSNGRWVLTGQRGGVLPNSAMTPMIMEETQYSNEVSYTNSCGESITSEPTQHFNGSNYAFLDGHVVWLTRKAYSDIECSNRLNRQ